MATVARNTSASVVFMVVTAAHNPTPLTAAFIQGVPDDPLTRVAIRRRSLSPTDRTRSNLWNSRVVVRSGTLIFNFIYSNIEFNVSQVAFFSPVLIIIQRDRTSASNKGDTEFSSPLVTGYLY